MTVENMMGPALSLPTIERRVMAHLRLWFPTYLREAERQELVRSDGVAPLAPGSIPLPRSWEPTQGRVDKWPAAQLPAVIFGSPGLGEPPRRAGGGDYSGDWVFAMTGVASARDAASTRWVTGIYVLALRLLFVQQPLIEGLPVESCKWEDEAYDDLPFSRSGALMAGTATFTLGLGELASSAHGPPAPLENPIEDPGPWPTVQDTSLTVERN